MTKQKITLIGGVLHGRQFEIDHIATEFKCVTNPRLGIVSVWVIDWQKNEAHYREDLSGFPVKVDGDWK